MTMKSYEEILKEGIRDLETKLGIRVDPRIAKHMIRKNAKHYDRIVQGLEILVGTEIERNLLLNQKHENTNDKSFGASESMCEGGQNLKNEDVGSHPHENKHHIDPRMYDEALRNRNNAT